jgi:hypothetical protein
MRGPFGSHATQGARVTRLLLYINRRSGVAHVDRRCDAIASVPARYLRLELYDPARPRRMCSRCWDGGRPRSGAFAGAAVSVTERSEGNPRSGLTGADVAATPAAERAAGRRSRSLRPEPLRKKSQANRRDDGAAETDRGRVQRPHAVSQRDTDWNCDANAREGAADPGVLALVKPGALKTPRLLLRNHVSQVPVPVGSSNTRPTASTGTARDVGWEHHSELRAFRGYWSIAGRAKSSLRSWPTSRGSARELAGDRGRRRHLASALQDNPRAR